MRAFGSRHNRRESAPTLSERVDTGRQTRAYLQSNNSPRRTHCGCVCLFRVILSRLVLIRVESTRLVLSGQSWSSSSFASSHVVRPRLVSSSLVLSRLVSSGLVLSSVVPCLVSCPVSCHRVASSSRVVPCRAVPCLVLSASSLVSLVSFHVASCCVVSLRLVSSRVWMWVLNKRSGPRHGNSCCSMHVQKTAATNMTSSISSTQNAQARRISVSRTSSQGRVETLRVKTNAMGKPHTGNCERRKNYTSKRT